MFNCIISKFAHTAVPDQSTVKSEHLQKLHLIYVKILSDLYHSVDFDSTVL